MLDATFVLYVSDLAASRRFYVRLFGRERVPFEPTFEMFFLESGARVGLLVQEDKQAPPPSAASAGFELAFPVAENADVDRLHREWSALGTRIVHPPHDMAFAYNFTACDPDGYRLRVFCRRM